MSRGGFRHPHARPRFWPGGLRLRRRRRKRIGCKAIVLTHDFNTANELKDADQIITEEVAGVMWNVADPAASAVAVKKARAAGIPVINMDRTLVERKIVGASLESDNFQCGALAALAFVDMVGKTGNYAELRGPSSDAMDRTRSAGYHSALDKSGLKTVAQEAAAYDQTKGFQLAGSILRGHPDIKGFVPGNDSIGLGAPPPSRRRANKASWRSTRSSRAPRTPSPMAGSSALPAR